MGKAWIDHLADEIKEKGRDAAESYGRDKHRAGIVAAEGKVFFTSLVMCLEEDVNEIRRRLQGSAVSCDTAVVTEGPETVRLTRSRFPWFDATLKHADETIALEYAQGRGAGGDQSLLNGAERRTVNFAFQVDAQDKLFVVESFGEASRRFDKPDELTKYILELLFKV